MQPPESPQPTVDLSTAQLVPDTVDPTTPVTEPLSGEVFESTENGLTCLVLRTIDKKGKKLDTPITDCAVRVISSNLEGDEYSFEVALKRGHYVEHRATLTADDLVRTQSINAWAAKKARSSWNMDQDQLAAFRKWVMTRAETSKVVHSLRAAGYIPQFGVTIGVPYSIDAEGIICKPNMDGVFTLKCLKDGDKRLFRPPPLDQVHVPQIEYEKRMPLDAARAAVRQFHDVMRKYYGDNRGSIALGWTVSHLFRDILFSVRNCFPHLYVYGQPGVGKNELAMWMMRGVGTPFSDFPNQESFLSNPKGIRNSVAETCNYPLWVDELRQEPGVAPLLNFIRTTYNGSGSTVARIEHGHRSFPVRRSLILTGQHVVGMEAEMRRYVLINIEKVKGCPAAEVEAMIPQLQHALVTIAAHRHALVPYIMAYAVQYADILGKAGVDYLYAWPWGVALAGIRLSGWNDATNANPLDNLPKNCAAEAVAFAKSAVKSAASEGNIGQLWRVIESLDASAKLRSKGRDAWARAFVIGDKTPSWARGMKGTRLADDVARDKQGELLHHGKTYLAVWLAHLHDAYTQASMSRRTNVFPFDALIEEFRQSDGFVCGPQRVRLDADAGVPKRPCYIFRFEEQEAKCIPDWLREMVHAGGIVQADEAE